MADTEALATVVPFGKYKGKSVLEMIEDANYCDWVKGQPGIEQRYPAIFALIVNGGAGSPDAPTPEHNRIQERFADADYCRKVLALLGIVGAPAPPVPEGFKSWYDASAALREAGWDDYREKERADGSDARDAWRAVDKIIVSDRRTRIDVMFECAGWDVRLATEHYEDRFLIELKPSVGDDYPAIVRKVRERAASNERRGGCSQGQVIVAYDRWCAAVDVGKVRRMYGDIVWLQLPEVESA